MKRTQSPMSEIHSPLSRQHGMARFAMIGILCVVALLVGGVLMFSPAKKEDVAPSPSTPPVLVSDVELIEMAEKVEALGNVQANDAVTLTSKVTDRVKAIHFLEGQEVTAGTLLVELEDAEIRSELQEAKAALQDAESQLERSRNLKGAGAVSVSVIDERESLYQAAKARVDLFTVRLAERVITAPFDGILGLRNVSPGQLVSPGDPLVSLAMIDPVKVDFTVSEQYLGKLKPGLEIEARSVAYPDQVFEGKVAIIDPAVDAVSRSVKARAYLQNADRRLKPGMLLNRACPDTADALFAGVLR